MHKKLMFLMAFVLMFGLVSSASAVSCTWNNDNINQLWSDQDNWDTDTVPTSADKALFEPGVLGAYIVYGDAATASRVALGSTTAGTAASLTMNGGTLDVDKEFYIGGDVSSVTNVTGKFYMNGGTVTVGPGSDKFFVGYYGTGYLYMTGGSITSGRVYVAGEKADSTGYVMMSGGTINATSRLRVGGKDGSAGYLTITGGEIIAASLEIGPSSSTTIGQVNLHGGIIRADSFSMGSQGLLDITLGSLLLSGDEVSAIQGYVDSGLITAFSGYGTVSVGYIPSWGQTVVGGCIPEPATIALLGLGGLSLLRRRK